LQDLWTAGALLTPFDASLNKASLALKAVVPECVLSHVQYLLGDHEEVSREYH
jgi:hypothetical protein